MSENGGAKKKGGSVADAQAQANIPPTVEQGTPRRWSPGRYVLTEGRYQPVAGGQDLQRGDVVQLDKESDATRLGRAGVIAPVDSLEARRAQARDDRERAEIRLEELREEQRQLQEQYELGQEKDED